MPQFVAYEDVKAGRTERSVPGGRAWRTTFLQTDEEAGPQAFLAESSAHRILPTHFHGVDEFQVVVLGSGTLGRHPIAPFSVHFARANTPYGPIVAGDDGLGFLTIRARYDRAGAQYLPEASAKLKQIPDRHPWQIRDEPTYDASPEAVSVTTLENIKDDRGLAAYAIRAMPGMSIAAPDHSRSGGQYLIVLKGSLIWDGRQHNALSMSFVRTGDPSPLLTAGPQGMELLALHFPVKEGDTAVMPISSDQPAYKTWRCTLCAFTYDESKGLPEDGIAPGTRWTDVPDTWSCPDCQASKSDFDMVEI